MNRALVAASTALLLLACSRDLDLPVASHVALAPGFAAVAPREALTLAATGGRAPYRFEFAQGGRLSGDDATLDPVTGVYRAGGRGVALDLVQVTDAAGSVAAARISVGAPLGIGPGLAGTAPRGTVTFTATGGKPPYAFALEGGAGTGSQVDGRTGVYVAGPSSGDAVEKVVVTDATNDPGARAVAEVRVGRSLAIFPSASQAAAPGERLQFIGLGGDPPYVYTTAGGSAGAVDAAGVYRAGPTGSTIDTVTVVDGRGSSASVTVRVGPALAVGLASAELRPGLTAELVATGGKPPYVYRYASKGNRTRGAVGATGTYAPGAVVGGVDVVEVEDAVGAVARATLPALGTWRAHPPAHAEQCLAGDVDGDSREDAIFTDGASLSVLRLPSDGTVREQSYRFGEGASFYGLDLNHDRKLDLVAAGQTLLADPAGAFQYGPLAPWGSDHAAIWDDGYAYFRIATTDPCTPAGAATGTGIRWLSYPKWGVPFDFFEACEPVIYNEPHYAVEALVNGQLGPAGAVGVAWVESIATGVKRAWQTNTGWSSPAELIPFPAGWSWDPFHVRNRFVRLADTSDVGVVLVDAGGRGAPWLLRDGAFLGPFDPDPTSSGVTGLVARRQASSVMLAAWSAVDGRVYGFDLEPGGLPTAARVVASLPFPVSCVALLDANDDFLLDLSAASAVGAAADVLLGDGRSFGGGARFPGVTQGIVVDVDGDGRDDVVALTATPGVRVHFGGDLQLAIGPETPFPRQPTGFAVVRGETGLSLLWQDALGALWSAPLEPSGAVGLSASLAVTGVVPALTDNVYVSDASHAMALGATAPGGAVWWKTDSGVQQWNALLLDAPGHAISVRADAPSSSCRFGFPGIAAGQPVVAAVCDEDNGDGTGRWAVYRATLADGALSAWALAGSLGWTGGAGNGIRWSGEGGGSAGFLLKQVLASGDYRNVFVTVPADGAPRFDDLGTRPASSEGSQDAFRADVTGDGIPDVVLFPRNAPPRTVEIWTGLPAGGFSPPAAPAFEIIGWAWQLARAGGGATDLLVQVGNDLVLRRLAP